MHGAPGSTPPPPIIELHGVTKRFGATTALDGVDLRMARGEVVGLLGPNGAGKTTLLRILSTLTPPDTGSATVAGFDVVRDAVAVRAAIGLAGQSAALDPLLTGRENLDLIGRLYGLGPELRRTRTAEVLERFDLRGAADRPVGGYSGGMRRRLDLGATLVGRPEVLLLDEPTAGLDPRSRNELWVTVDELAADGTTILLTSQYLEEIERLATTVAVLDEGRILAEGPARTLAQRVGGDVLEIRLTDAAEIDHALDVVATLGGSRAHVEPDERRISLPSPGGTATLLDAGRRMEEAGIAIADIGIRHPSLDDVFFTLTGRSATLDDRPLDDRHGDGDGDGSPAEGAERQDVLVGGQGPTAPVTPADGAVDAVVGWVTSPDASSADGATAARRSRAPRRGLRAAAGDAGAITGRYLTRMRRNPESVFYAAVQPLLFVFALWAVFGGLVEDAEGGSYIQFLLPGVVVMNMALAAGVTGIGLAEDVQAGIIDRFRSLPMARSAVLVGRTAADLARNVMSLVIMVAAGALLGYRPDGGVGGAVAAVGVVLLFGYAFSWVFAAIGVATRDVAAAQFAGFVPVVSLVFLSGAWIPVESMVGGVQAFARNQPVNVTIEAARALSEGTADARDVWLSLAWSAAILTAASTYAVRRFAAPS
ncbi:MAG: ATP-binding cassette domain-containing protein [Actinomycetota bacterium]|nr:ATP-binding cassette domain-containing protein [Actinomycetota bacterium]